MVHHRRRIPAEMRDALYAYSRCIVYPSIHREPFGMVAAESMSHGTPVIVPDIGGINQTNESYGVRRGLALLSWDLGRPARQNAKLPAKRTLQREPSDQAPPNTAKCSLYT